MKSLMKSQPLVLFLSSTKIMKLASQWLSVTSLHILLAEQLYNLHSTSHDIVRAAIKGQKNLLHLSRLYRPVMLQMNLSVVDIIHPQNSLLGSRDGAVVRVLASHQCVPGSIPGPGAICGLSLLLVLFSAWRGFFPSTLVFPSPQKPTFPKSNSSLEKCPQLE